MIDGDRERDSDRLARRAAQTVFDRPIALEAGAGTGKTTALVARVVVWSLGRGWERAETRIGGEAMANSIAPAVLGGVVAITFTEAAAAQMEERVAAALVAVAEGKDVAGIDADLLPEARVARARALLGALDHLVVRTIHSFCRRILAAYPLEAGLDPNFAVDADLSALEGLVLERVGSAVVAAYQDPIDPDHLALAREGIGPREIAEGVLALASEAVSPATLEVDPFAPAQVRAAARELRERLVAARREGGSRLLGVTRAPRTQSTQQALDHFESVLDGLVMSGVAEELSRRAREVFERIDVRLREWARGKFTGGEVEILGEVAPGFVERVAAVRDLLKAIASTRPLEYSSARRVLGGLLGDVERLARARGIVTFTGLLEGARSLLESCPEVRRRLRHGIDQLLVDEVQDTDPVQCAIVRALAFDDADRGGSPGLFLVGDPKQSIYGWRSADLAAYEELLAAVRDGGGEIHALAVSFRSVPAILEEVDRSMAPILVKSPGLQPAYQRLVPAPARADAPGFSAGGRSPTEFWSSIAWDPGADGLKAKTRAGEAAEIEANAIASDIAELHDQEGVRFGSVALLLRSTGDLAIYLTALRAAGVPYEVARDRGYYQRREVIEAAALIRLLFDPNDHLALVTVMRAAWVGVPDVAILPLWSREFPGLLSELNDAGPRHLGALDRVIDEVAALDFAGVPGIARVRGWHESLKHLVHVLGELRTLAATAPADEVVERLRDRLAPEVTEAARYLGRFRVANLDRFFRGVVTTIEASGGDVHSALRELRESVSSARAAEEARPRDQQTDAVAVLTIHQAKGLDFDHVYVGQLHKGRPRAGALGTIREATADGFELALLGFPSLRFDRALARRQRIEAAERVRTLYVAMTRARERLVMLGKWSRHDIVGVEAAESYSDLLTPRRPPLPDPEVILASADGARLRQGDRVETAGTVLRLAALAPRATVARVASATTPEFGAEDRAGLVAEVLRRREFAERRMQRTIAGTASGMAAHDDRAEFAASRYREEREESSTDAGGRDVALAVGTSIHGVLEAFDFGADFDRECERQRLALASLVKGGLGDEHHGLALDRASRFFDRLIAGNCFRRLRDVHESIVARELSVMLPADSDDGPLGYVAGAIDLVYRDPERGDLVVVDYKTDFIEQESELDERVDRYRAQGAIYTRALREALSLESTPRFELWFLYPDAIRAIAE